MPQQGERIKVWNKWRSSDEATRKEIGLNRRQCSALESSPLTSDGSPSTPPQVTWSFMVPTKWYAKLGQNVRPNEDVTSCWRLLSDVHMVWHTFYISKHPSFSLHICQIGHLRPLRPLPCISPLYRVWGNTQMSGGASMFSRGSFFLHSSNIDYFELCSFLFLDH